MLRKSSKRPVVAPRPPDTRHVIPSSRPPCMIDPKSVTVTWSVGPEGPRACSPVADRRTIERTRSRPPERMGWVLKWACATHRLAARSWWPGSRQSDTRACTLRSLRCAAAPVGPAPVMLLGCSIPVKQWSLRSPDARMPPAVRFPSCADTARTPGRVPPARLKHRAQAVQPASHRQGCHRNGRSLVAVTHECRMVAGRACQLLDRQAPSGKPGRPPGRWIRPAHRLSGWRLRSSG
jgi:hypothetical protein